MFDEFMTQPVVKDITYITVKPADQTKAKWAEALKELPVVAYMVVGIKANMPGDNPNDAQTFVACGGSMEDMEIMKASLDVAVANRPDITKGKRGQYAVELPDNFKEMVSTIDPSNHLTLDKLDKMMKQAMDMKKQIDKERRPGLISRFVKWLV